MPDSQRRETVEQWARIKGHTRLVAHPELRKKKGAEVPVEHVLDWQFAATKAHEQWPLGLELTEAQYDAAVQAATGVALR